MSENRPGDDQDSPQSRQGQIGLSIPREDTEQRSGRPRRRPGAYEKFQQAAKVDEKIVERWFLPVTVLFLVLLVIGMAIYIAQASQLDSLQREVAALKEQVAESGPDSGVDRLLARVETLGSRLETINDLNARVQALESAIADQGSAMETLSGKVTKLERGSGTGGSGSSAGTAASGDTAASQQAANGGWVINLITVADRAAAESFQKRLDDLGVDSRIEAVTVNDQSLQRVVVPGFTSRDAAESTGAELKRRLELSDNPWIARQ